MVLLNVIFWRKAMLAQIAESNLEIPAGFRETSASAPAESEYSQKISRKETDIQSVK
jgi:hypothetical protein